MCIIASCLGSWIVDCIVIPCSPLPWHQIRVRLLALLLLTVCVLVLYAVGWNTCASLRLAWLGYVL